MKRLLKLVSVTVALVMIFSFGVTGCTDPKLDAPASVSYADGALSWTAVEGATAYDVVVYQASGTTVALAKQTVTGTSVSVASLAAGDYTASVTATAEGKTASNEKTHNFTVAAPLTALPTPTGFAYANGKVTWGAVTGATNGYTVKVVLKSDGSVAITEQTATAAELDVSALGAGEYTVSVQAKAVTGAFNASQTAAYDFTVEVVKAKLDTPSGGAVDALNRKITWTAVTGATGYKVKAAAGTTVIFDKVVTEAEVGISEVETDEFVLTVTATGDAGTTVQSDEYVYNVKINGEKLAAPSNIAADAAQDILSWSDVAGSDAYRLVISDGQGTIVDEELIETAYGISGLGAGTYTVRLQTLADPYDIFRADSDEADETLVIASLGDYEQITNLRIAGGYMAWDQNNARGYEITVTEKGKTQALSLNGVTAADNSFMIAACGLTTGGYTVTVTPKDNRHNTETGTPASYDITLTDLRSFSAADIALFDGSAPVGEHANAQLVTLNGKQVAKVTPTVDGWGRIGSEAIAVNYDKNPVLYIDIEDLEIGGFHAEIQIGGNNHKILDDGAKLADIAVMMKVTGVSGSNNTIIRLGVDNSSTTAANDAVAYYNGCRVLTITDYVAPFAGQLDAVTGFEISNGMDVEWDAVDNADSYYVTLTNNADSSVVYAKAEQTGITFRARDLAAGEYKLTVSAFSSVNESALESEIAAYEFKVSYLAEYSASDIAEFANVLLGDSNLSVAYDSGADTAVYNSTKTYGYGAIAPATGVSANLTNRPFAVVDVARIDYGYLIRGGWTPEGSDSPQTLVLRNDTVTTISDTKLYIELWKKADQSGAAVLGTGAYAFGMGFLAGGDNQGQVVLNGIRLVEITEIDIPIPGSLIELNTPSSAQEAKGVLTAQTVKGNSAYTPSYAVTVTEKEGAEVYAVTGLAAPSVDLAALGLTNGKTYTVDFQAIGDNDYFVDSDVYTVEVLYTEAYALTDFSGLDYTTKASLYGGVTTLTGTDGALTSTVIDGEWGFNFFNIDVDDIRDVIAGCYMQWTIDVENSTAGANIATRFFYPTNSNVVGTGVGDSALQKAFLTMEWQDKIDGDGVIWFAFGQGGATTGTATKTVICTSIKFVKFTVSEVAGA